MRAAQPHVRRRGKASFTVVHRRSPAPGRRRAQPERGPGHSRPADHAVASAPPVFAFIAAAGRTLRTRRAPAFATRARGRIAPARNCSISPLPVCAWGRHARSRHDSPSRARATPARLIGGRARPAPRRRPDSAASSEPAPHQPPRRARRVPPAARPQHAAPIAVHSTMDPPGLADAASTSISISGRPAGANARRAPRRSCAWRRGRADDPVGRAEDGAGRSRVAEASRTWSRGHGRRVRCRRRRAGSSRADAACSAPARRARQMRQQHLAKIVERPAARTSVPRSRGPCRPWRAGEQPAATPAPAASGCRPCDVEGKIPGHDRSRHELERSGAHSRPSVVRRRAWRPRTAVRCCGARRGVAGGRHVADADRRA